MKTIKGLDRKLQQTFGEDDQLPKEIQDAAPKFRAMVLKQIGNTKGRDGEESTLLWQVGMKIRSGFQVAAPEGTVRAADEVDLEDAEFKLVYESCNTMKGEQWPSLFHGQVMVILNEAKEGNK